MYLETSCFSIFYQDHSNSRFLQFCVFPFKFIYLWTMFLEMRTSKKWRQSWAQFCWWNWNEHHLRQTLCAKMFELCANGSVKLNGGRIKSNIIEFPRFVHHHHHHRVCQKKIGYVRWLNRGQRAAIAKSQTNQISAPMRKQFCFDVEWKTGNSWTDDWNIVDQFHQHLFPTILPDFWARKIWSLLWQMAVVLWFFAWRTKFGEIDPVPCVSGIWTNITWFADLALGSSQLLLMPQLPLKSYKIDPK